jgi:CHAT domain-containing protein
VALSYVFAEGSVYAFVVQQGRPLLARRLADSDSVLQATAALRTLISGAEDAVAWRRPDGRFGAGPIVPAGAAAVHDWGVVARELGRALLEPFAGIVGSAKTLYIVPDGSLAELPFDALFLDGKPLVKSTDVRFVQSLSVMNALRQREARVPSERRTLLSMGAPAYGSGDSSLTPATQLARAVLRAVGTSSSTSAKSPQPAHWSPLPGALQEVREVREAFIRRGYEPRDLVALTGREASESALQQMNRSRELKTFRYLHFAAHGYLNNDDPSLSAVVLSQEGATSEEDGYMTAAKWARLDVDSDLIVLSACETGRGASAEGVTGLPYAMFAAGNRTAVLSLWRVNDSSTARFMRLYFDLIAAGEESASALAKTKRLISSDPRYAAPVHWAGFIAYGR